MENFPKKQQLNNSFGGVEVLLGVKKEVIEIALPFLKYLNTLTPEQRENYRSQFACLINEINKK